MKTISLPDLPKDSFSTTEKIKILLQGIKEINSVLVQLESNTNVPINSFFGQDFFRESVNTHKRLFNKKLQRLLAHKNN